jgi:hypothetical protein
LAQINEAWTGPNSKELESLARPTCTACRNYLDTAISLEESMRRYSGSPASFGPSIVMPESTRALTVVQMAYKQNKTTIVNARGDVTDRMSSLRVLTEVSVAWVGSGWLVDEIRLLKPST